MRSRWLIALPIVLVAALVGWCLYAILLTPHVIWAEVSKYQYADGKLSIGIDLEGPVEGVDWLEPRPYKGPWTRRGWSGGGAGYGNATPSSEDHVEVTLRRVEGISLADAPTTIVPFVLTLSHGRSAVLAVSINNSKIARGAANAVAAGVSRVSNDGKEVRKAWADELQYKLGDGWFADAEIPFVKDLIGELRSATERIPPRLVTAQYWSNDAKGHYDLALGFYDESGIVSTLRIREFGPDGQTLVEEDYELYPRSPRPDIAFLYDQPVFAFQPRTTGQVKDDAAWATYAAAEDRPSIEHLPTIWISLPSESWHVAISLVDRNGRETQSVPLTMSRTDCP